MGEVVGERAVEGTSYAEKRVDRLKGRGEDFPPCPLKGRRSGVSPLISLSPRLRISANWLAVI